MALNPENPQARYRITFARSNKALSVLDTSKAPGTPVVQLPINQDAGQQWRMVDRQDGIFTIVSVNSGLAMTANTRGQDSTVFQSPDTGDPSQQWRIHPIGIEEQYVITSILTSLDLVATGMEDGAPIITAPQPLIFPPIAAWKIEPV